MGQTRHLYKRTFWKYTVFLLLSDWFIFLFEHSENLKYFLQQKDTTHRMGGNFSIKGLCYVNNESKILQKGARLFKILYNIRIQIWADIFPWNFKAILSDFK